LRHTFAVRALEASNSMSIAENELALSTYLGHATVASTYRYLEATPRLLTSIAAHCARFARKSR
jgi:integrase